MSLRRALVPLSGALAVHVGLAFVVVEGKAPVERPPVVRLKIANPLPPEVEPEAPPPERLSEPEVEPEPELALPEPERLPEPELAPPPEPPPSSPEPPTEPPPVTSPSEPTPASPTSSDSTSPEPASPGGGGSGGGGSGTGTGGGTGTGFAPGVGYSGPKGSGAGGPPGPPGPKADPAVVKADFRRYGRGVHKRIDDEKHYPAAARSLRLEGRATVRLEIDREGRLIGEPSIVESTGHDVLDDEALRMVKRAAPFDALPDNFPKPTASIVIPLSFKLE